MNARSVLVVAWAGDRHHGGGERSARRFGPGGTGECSAGGALLPSDARSGGRTRRAVEREGSEWGEDYRCAGVLGGATAARNQCAQRPVGLAEQAAVWPQVREKRPTPTLGSDARGRRSGGWEQPRGERHTAGSERPRSACWPEATPARAATRCPRPQAAAPLASAGPDHASHFIGSRAHLCDLWPASARPGVDPKRVRRLNGRCVWCATFIFGTDMDGVDIALPARALAPRPSQPS